jgi:ubiquinone/menaquinone biosynthesis C-methylase UbiE
MTEPVSHRLAADARNRALWELATAVGGSTPRRLLDLGCGTTVPLQEFVAARPHPDQPVAVLGMDHDAGLLTSIPAGETRPPVVVGEAIELPLPDHSIDMACAFTLFSSIPTAAGRRATAAEIVRVLVPGGLVAWYDLRYPSPRNPNVTALSGRAVEQLFPGCTATRRSVTVLPPLCRLVVPSRPSRYDQLVRVPFLRSHLAMIVRTPG